MCERLLTIREAAEVLNISYYTLRNKVTARQVPFTCPAGRSVRFTQEHIQEIIRAGERRARGEAQGRPGRRGTAIA